jgi:hypothetical protein
VVEVEVSDGVAVGVVDGDVVVVSDDGDAEPGVVSAEAYLDGACVDVAGVAGGEDADLGVVLHG